MRTEYSERLANTNINRFSLHYLHYKPFHKELYRAIGDYAKGNVLDIGCGNKPYEEVFGTQISTYVGCDIMQSHLNKVDVLCEANNIPLESSTFETIFSTQTIEHVEDHQGLVNEAFRLLKPGGFFILAGPFVWPLHEEPYDFFRFTKYGFKYILEKAGFEMIETLPNGGMWATSGLGLIHSFSHSKSKNFIARGMRFVFFKLRFIWIINSIFSWLDKVDYNPVNTINYVVVAKKPQVNLPL